jgi:hypothetical protein
VSVQCSSEQSKGLTNAVASREKIACSIVTSGVNVEVASRQGTGLKNLHVSACEWWKTNCSGYRQS